MQVGQKLSGALASYTIQAQIYRTVYSAISSVNKQQVIVKTERVTHQLDNERAVLTHFRNSPHMRQLIDEIQDPPALVLNRLDGDISDAAKEKPVRGRDLKFVARIVLERLRDMHEAGLIHTDVKPRNILVNKRQEQEEQATQHAGAKSSSGSSHESCPRFSEVQLNDFGDSFPVRSVFDFNVKQPFIGAALWRSPEAILGLRWDTSTDVWSFGATMLSLIYGRGNHIFKPTVCKMEDPNEYEFQVLVKQLAHFGPWPESLMEVAQDSTRDKMQKAWTLVTENKMHTPFNELPDHEVDADEKEFLTTFMKLDPRQRPKAGDLLKHAWFGDGRTAGLRGLHTG